LAIKSRKIYDPPSTAYQRATESRGSLAIAPVSPYFTDTRESGCCWEIPVLARRTYSRRWPLAEHANLSESTGVSVDASGQRLTNEVLFIDGPGREARWAWRTGNTIDRMVEKLFEGESSQSSDFVSSRRLAGGERFSPPSVPTSSKVGDLPVLLLQKPI